MLLLSYCRLCLPEEADEALRARYEIILKQREESDERLEEAKAAAKYMYDGVAHYEAILTGLAADDTPTRTGRQETARLTQVSQTKR